MTASDATRYLYSVYFSMTVSAAAAARTWRVLSGDKGVMYAPVHAYGNHSGIDKCGGWTAAVNLLPCSDAAEIPHVHGGAEVD